MNNFIQNAYFFYDWLKEAWKILWQIYQMVPTTLIRYYEIVLIK